MDLYREEILEHWQNPSNFGKFDDADLVIDQVNPLCGDKVTFFFKFSQKHLRGGVRASSREHLGGDLSDVMIDDVSFTGSGCAISIAASSMLSEYMKGKKVSSLSKLTGDKVLGLIGGPVTPARLKCAFLPLEVIRKLKDNI